MRVLYISSSWPFGAAFGGQLRALQVARALKEIGEVSIAVVNSEMADEAIIRQTSAEFGLPLQIQVQTAPNRDFAQKLRWAFDCEYLNVHGCFAPPNERNRLLERLPKFDLIWVLNSRTPNILNQWKWPHSVLDIDDVPSTFQRTVWQNGNSMKQRLKAGVQMQLLKRRERRLKERFDVLTVCSEGDRQYLGGGDHIHVIPNGFQKPEHEPLRRPVNPPRIGFIGLYSYLPNLEGIRWFVKECWAQIKQQVPYARLRLVGKDTDGPLKPNAPDVDALGWVADPAAEIATWSAMIVPVLSGGGTRIKIAEAFSRKCPLVSTSVGAYGYEVEHGKDLLLADEPNDFAIACVTLIRDPKKGAALAESGWEKFLNNWTWDAITPRVHAAAEACLNGGVRDQRR